MFDLKNYAFFSSPKGIFPFYWRTVLRPHLRESMLIGSLMIVSATLEMITIGLSVPLLESITSLDAVNQTWVISAIGEWLALAGLSAAPNVLVLAMLTFIIGLFILSGGVRLLHEYLTALVAHQLHRDVRSRLFENFMSACYEDVSTRGRAQTLHDIRIPSLAVYQSIRHLAVLFAALFNTVLLFILLLYLSWWATLVICVLIVFGVRTLRKGMDERAERYGRDIYELQSDQEKTEVDAIDGLKMVKAQGLEVTMAFRHRSLLNAEIPKLLRLTIFRHFPLFLNESVAGIVVLILGAITFLAPSWGMTFPILVAFLLAVRRTSPAIASINSTLVELNVSRRSVEVVDEILRLTVHETHGGQLVARVDEVRFENVSLTYASRPDRPALDGINFATRKNSINVIVGRTGAGKSSLVNLLIGLFRPDSGRVVVDGTDLSQLDLSQWRKRIGYVSQDIFLFNSTVRDNITSWSEDVSDGEVERAARVARLHEFISDLPDGYDTRVGDRGLELSGGQCQRIAIARAVLRRPEILIFDEATSALDNQTERAVYDAMEGLRENAIVIVIAHRLSTVQRADQILVLDQGRLVEQGKHEYLLQIGGIYSDLYNVDDSAENGNVIATAHPGNR